MYLLGSVTLQITGDIIIIIITVALWGELRRDQTLITHPLILHITCFLVFLFYFEKIILMLTLMACSFFKPSSRSSYPSSAPQSPSMLVVRTILLTHSR